MLVAKHRALSHRTPAAKDHHPNPSALIFEPGSDINREFSGLGFRAKGFGFDDFGGLGFGLGFRAQGSGEKASPWLSF